jgi:hypothetical protein
MLLETYGFASLTKTLDDIESYFSVIVFPSKPQVWIVMPPPIFSD